MRASATPATTITGPSPLGARDGCGGRMFAGGHSELRAWCVTSDVAPKVQAGVGAAPRLLRRRSWYGYCTCGTHAGAVTADDVPPQGFMFSLGRACFLRIGQSGGEYIGRRRTLSAKVLNTLAGKGGGISLRYQQH